MKETNFKMTEIGLIPQDWDISSIGEAFDFLSNNTLSRESLTIEKSEIKNIHYGDVLVKYGEVLDCSRADIPYIDKEAPFKVKSKAENGDIILADTAEDEIVGKCCELSSISDDTVVAGLHTMWLRPKSCGFAEKYLGYALNSSLYHNQLLPLLQGIKVLSISKNAIKPTSFVYPKDKSEQTRIASALSEVDALLTSLDKLIAKKQAIKEGTMQQLLTGKTRLEGFDGEWKEYSIEELFDLGNGYTPSKEVPEFWNNGTIPWFRMEDIRKNGRILKDSIQHITPLAVKGGRLFPKNSIIISTTATIGEHALLIADSLANQQFTFLNRKVNRCGTIDIIFFFHYCTILGAWCRENINEGGLAAVNMEEFKAHSITIPPSIIEQQAIASILTSMDSELSALQAKRKKYEAIKQGMMQQLLTGKVRLI